MKLPKFSGKPRRPNILLVRQVMGTSMMPALAPGCIVVGVFWRRIRPGQIVIIRHEGLEKIKRIQEVRLNQIFVAGDNPAASTDSRHFGWLPVTAVLARIIWPRR